MVGVLQGYYPPVQSEHSEGGYTPRADAARAAGQLSASSIRQAVVAAYPSPAISPVRSHRFVPRPPPPPPTTGRLSSSTPTAPPSTFTAPPSPLLMAPLTPAVAPPTAPAVEKEEQGSQQQQQQRQESGDSAEGV